MDEPPANTIILMILSGENLIYTMSFIVIAVLLMMSAIVSASEVAFFSLKPDDLTKCQDSIDDRDRNIPELLAHPRTLLATILIVTHDNSVAESCSRTVTLRDACIAGDVRR